MFLILKGSTYKVSLPFVCRVSRGLVLPHYEQGCDGSRYRFDRPRIEAVFWLWVGFFEPILAHAILLKYLSIVSKNLEPVSGSRSENQKFWIGNSLDDEYPNKDFFLHAIIAL